MKKGLLLDLTTLMTYSCWVGDIFLNIFLKTTFLLRTLSNHYINSNKNNITN